MEILKAAFRPQTIQGRASWMGSATDPCMDAPSNVGNWRKAAAPTARRKIETPDGRRPRLTSFALANRAVRRRRTARTRQHHYITEMNQLDPSDSKLSLDRESRGDDHAGMITQPYHLYIERTDLTKNMARFYAMTIEPNLFGQPCLTLCWGRIGTKGQTMSHQFETEREAVVLFLNLLRQKKRRGYSAVVRQSRTYI